MAFTLAACGGGNSAPDAKKKDADNTRTGVIAGPASGEKPTYPKPAALAVGSQASLDKLTYKGGTPTIAYLPMGTEFNYHKALYEGIKTVPGMKSFMLSPYSGSDQAGQLGMLQDVTARADVDAILLISFDEHSLAPLVKKAVDAGKAVVIINSDIPNYPTPVDGVVGVTQRAANKDLARWAIRTMGGKARKVGILNGEPSYLDTERAGGFQDGIKGTNWKLVAHVNGGWSVEKGNTAAMDLLQAHPEINVIFAANDYMAEGAAQAVKALGRNDVKILGYDGDTAAIESIANGDGVTATTNTNPVQMGRMAAQFAIDLLHKKADGGYVDAPAQIVSKDNALKVLRDPAGLFPKPSKSY
ncbi:sugar ABC transporter substrate-binding protein [Streptomyces sp. NPDC004065]|uniref:sugar ABC transporter substrate-binding protein n=1 Tax=Streptomyces sp. NPDC004065 TaxID=3364689 RepID=UPI00384A9D7E